MPLIKKKIPQVKLTIAGEGDLAPYEEYMTEDIKDNIVIVNRYLDEKEVAPFFQKASIVVIPYHEASSSGLVQCSYAFGKPLISTNVGAIPEVVENRRTGILIPPNNPGILAKEIVKLLKDDKKMKMLGENGYLKMKNFMNWDYQSKILQAEYKKLVEEKESKKKK